jgi:hypothetical protein
MEQEEENKKKKKSYGVRMLNNFSSFYFGCEYYRAEKDLMDIYQKYFIDGIHRMKDIFIPIDKTGKLKVRMKNEYGKLRNDIHNHINIKKTYNISFVKSKPDKITLLDFIKRTNILHIVKEEEEKNDGNWKEHPGYI